MHGYEIENDDPAEDNEIITYSEEDCKFYSVFPDLLLMKWLELVTLVLLNPFKSNNLPSIIRKKNMNVCLLSQCGILGFFLLLRFYGKSILMNCKTLKPSFSQVD